MVFALAAALLTALAVAAVLLPVLRRQRRGPARADYDLAVYRDQLRELESDRSRGLVSEEQVEAARTEIERRMLRAARARDAAEAVEATEAAEAADVPEAAGARALARLWRRRAAALALGLCVPALAAGLYGSLGSPELPGSPFAERAPPVDDPAVAAFEEPVERLAARLESDPDNLEGWLLLGRAYLVLQRFAEAADALRQAAALAGDDPEILSMLGETVVWANDGTVVPEAVRAFQRVLVARPEDPAARFHLALAQAQAGAVREAYDMWLALAADTPADAPWRSDLESLTSQAAAMLDVAPAAALRPPAVADAPAVADMPAGPTTDDLEAAAEMTPDERMTMIRGMVESLAARLEENPDDPEGWRRLARSYAVLGEPAKAADTLRRAVELAPDDIETLRAYARALTGPAGPEPPPPAATAVHERILALDPDDRAALWFVGLAAADRGDRAGARAHWQRLLILLAPGTAEHEAVRSALDGL